MADYYEPNDDDLINDYIEEGGANDHAPLPDWTEPPSDDEDEQDKSGNAQRSEQEPEGGQKPDNAPALPLETPATAAIDNDKENLNPEPDEEEQDEEIGGRGDDGPPRMIGIRTREKVDPYSFEHFGSSRQRRRSGGGASQSGASAEQSSNRARDNTMTAHQWKSNGTATIALTTRSQLEQLLWSGDKTGGESLLTTLDLSSPESGSILAQKQRQLRQERRFELKIRTSDQDNNDATHRTLAVASLLPRAHQRCVAVTLSRGGKRLYLRYRSTTTATSSSFPTLRKHTLLSRSMSDLRRRAHALEQRQLRRQQRIVATNHSTKGKDALWVDKHSPSTFCHLLSDERTNREVLRALRQWDPYVFGKPCPPRPEIPLFGASHKNANQQPAKNHPSPTNNHKSKLESREEKQTPPSSSSAKDTRPDLYSRVILLSGPPGVGKTTLAHIVAQHAGYRPVEVNASDDRSASVLRERVLRAMESSTLAISPHHGKKPNCLILDEVDGADAKSTIAGLVDIICAEQPAKNDMSSARRRSKPRPYLRRPMIFICNQKYVPALRPLLPYALQFDVGPPTTNRLVARLRAILRLEGVLLQQNATSLLHQLVEQSGGGDIRSCLHTLQLAAQSGNTNDLTSSLTQALQGRRAAKDVSADLAHTVSAVFTKSRPLAGRRKENRGADHVLQLVDALGDVSKTMDSVFLNVPSVSFLDPSLARSAAVHEWLSGADLFRSMGNDWTPSDQFLLQRHYTPAGIAAAHVLCGVESCSNRLSFSLRPLIDLYYQRQAHEGLVQQFLGGLSPRLRRLMLGRATQEWIPHVVCLLSGSSGLDRAVSSVDLLSRSEQVAFDQHVSLLRCLGLDYQKRQQNGNVGDTVQLEPNLEQLIQFREIQLPRSMRRKSISPMLRELLAHQARLLNLQEKQQMAQAVGEQNDMVTKAARNANGKGTMHQEKNGETWPKGPPLKPQGPKTKKPLDFVRAFADRKRKAVAAARKAKVDSSSSCSSSNNNKRVKLSHTGTQIPLSQVFKFKYQKGFTQAVRKTCHLEDLW